MKISVEGHSIRFVSSCLLLICALAYGRAQADDWPHWRGPNWNDKSNETGLLTDWPKDGPTQLWINKTSGLGYAGISIVGDQLFTLGLEDDSEFALCLNAETGEEIWRQNVSEKFENKWGDGPRSTPSVDGDHVYVMTANGTVACLKKVDGSEVWKIELQDFGGKIPFWGYSESPLVDGEQLVCTPGGSQGTILAVNKMTGQKIWQSEAITTEVAGKPSEPATAHYASIIPIDWNNQRQYVQLTVLAVVGLSAKDGTVLWRSDWPGRVAVIPSPIFADGQVYVTSGYSVGSKLIQLGPDNSATDVWYNKVMQNHHGGVVQVGNYFYGSGDQAFVCQDKTTGERKWAQRRIAKGATGYADGHFYHVQESDGKVMLFTADENGPELIAHFTLSPQTERRARDGRIWVHPVIANGKLYLRDQEIVYCYDVKRQ